MARRQHSGTFAVNRRSILAGASALLTVAPLAARAAAGDAVSGVIAITDLVDDSGQPTQRARGLAGRTIALRGYAAPSSLAAAAALTLTEGSQAPCQLCGLIHEAGPAVLVKPKDTLPASLSMVSRVEVRGKLDVGDGDVRIEDATIQVL